MSIKGSRKMLIFMAFIIAIVSLIILGLSIRYNASINGCISKTGISKSKMIEFRSKVNKLETDDKSYVYRKKEIINESERLPDKYDLVDDQLVSFNDTIEIDIDYINLKFPIDFKALSDIGYIIDEEYNDIELSKYTYTTSILLKNDTLGNIIVSFKNYSNKSKMITESNIRSITFSYEHIDNISVNGIKFGLNKEALINKLDDYELYDYTIDNKNYSKLIYNISDDKQIEFLFESDILYQITITDDSRDKK